MEKITSKDMFEQKKMEDNAIFLFSADWCGDCIFIKPELPAIEESFSNYTFYSIDRDEMIDLCQELDVFGIPSFLAFKEGKEIGRFVSKDRKTREEIEEFILGLQ